MDGKEKKPCSCGSQFGPEDKGMLGVGVVCTMQRYCIEDQTLGEIAVVYFP